MLETVQRLKNFSAPVILVCAPVPVRWGLGWPARLPDAKVICVELSPLALPYLERNLSRYGEGRVRAIKGDVLNGPDGLSLPPVDAVVSIRPHLYRGTAGAAKGSAAGAAAGFGRRPGWTKLFYRAITNNWLGLLKPGGVAAVEIGNGQENAVADLLRTAGVSQITCSLDLTGAIRVVAGNKNICL